MANNATTRNSALGRIIHLLVPPRRVAASIAVELAAQAAGVPFEARLVLGVAVPLVAEVVRRFR